MDISIFEKILTLKSRSIPLVVDENTAIECITKFLGIQILSLDECRTWNYENLYLYEKEEDKTLISVKVVRDWISDLSEKPYSGKNLYILRDFDESTPQAMNASLKALEEPPSYAIILLVVKNPEELLETIRSRTIRLFSRYGSSPLSFEIEDAVEKFLAWKQESLIEIIQNSKLDEETTFLILIELLKKTTKEDSDRIEQCIEDLLEVHENPRNILDRAILYL